MSENELRIGNLFWLNDGTDSIVKVEEIYKVHPHAYYFIEWNRIQGRGDTSKGNSVIDALKPISLTSQLLEYNCGFRRITSGSPEYKLAIRTGSVATEDTCAFYSIVLTGQSSLGVIYTVNGIVCSEPVLYLHQLQNLYFTLTRTELLINIEAAFI